MVKVNPRSSIIHINITVFGGFSLYKRAKQQDAVDSFVCSYSINNLWNIHIKHLIGFRFCMLNTSVLNKNEDQYTNCGKAVEKLTTPFWGERGIVQILGVFLKIGRGFVHGTNM